MASAATLLKPFTEEALREWVERDERRKDLEREARMIKAENDLIAKDLLFAMLSAEKQQLSRGSFEAAVDVRRGTVSWKEEFIRVAGAEQAKTIADNAPLRESLIIRRAS